MSGDNHVPHSDGVWKFDKSVTDDFDRMLSNSIPQYNEMRDLCFNLGRNFVSSDSTVMDIGASRGEALRPFIEQDKARSFAAVEVSEPMAAVLSELYSSNSKVSIYQHDIRDFPWRDMDQHNLSLILSVLTLQFTPIEYRIHILQSIYDALEPGGAFLLVEKVLGSSSMLDSILVREYYAMKNVNGYSEQDIARKRASLEGVLVPVTATWNEDMLRTVGFRQTDCFYRSLNFAGWIAVK